MHSHQESAADFAPVGLLVIDQSGFCSYANAEFVRLSAVPVTQLRGAGWLSTVHPHYRPAVRSHLAALAAAAGGSPTGSPGRIGLAARLCRPDGELLPVRLTLTAGPATGVTVAVTERWPDEPALPDDLQSPHPATYLQWLLVLLKVIPCAVALEDVAGRVMLVNDQFCRMFTGPDASPEVAADWTGRTSAELAGWVAAQLDDPDGYLARAAELVRGRVLRTDEVLAVDGRLFERDYVPILENGVYVGHVWMFWDFTERKAAEVERERQLRAEITAQRLGVHAQRERAVEAELTGRALAEQNEALAAIDALRSQLLATASHELRTPLTSILSFCEMLTESSVANSEEAQFVEVIARNADRLRHLVDDLLLLARLGSGAQPLELSRVDLVQLVHRVVLDCSLAAAARNLDVRVDGPAELQLDVDPARLVQVLDNLIGNAIKYSRPGGPVVITLSADAAAAGIEVTDCGIGIALTEQGELFGQFFRASSALASGVPGTGLGLAIVRTIVELHEGTVSLTSELGVGTSVQVRLPIRLGSA